MNIRVRTFMMGMYVKGVSHSWGDDEEGKVMRALSTRCDAVGGLGAW